MGLIIGYINLSTESPISRFLFSTLREATPKSHFLKVEAWVVRFDLRWKSRNLLETSGTAVTYLQALFVLLGGQNKVSLLLPLWCQALFLRYWVRGGRHIVRWLRWLWECFWFYSVLFRFDNTWVCHISSNLTILPNPDVLARNLEFCIEARWCVILCSVPSSKPLSGP